MKMNLYYLYLGVEIGMHAAGPTDSPMSKLLVEQEKSFQEYRQGLYS